MIHIELFIDMPRFYADMLSVSSRQNSENPRTQPKTVADTEPVEGAVQPKLKMGLIENVKKLWDSVRMTVFVVGTALTVFVAARNTITWCVS